MINERKSTTTKITDESIYFKDTSIGEVVSAINRLLWTHRDKKLTTVSYTSKHLCLRFIKEGGVDEDRAVDLLLELLKKDKDDNNES